MNKKKMVLRTAFWSAFTAAFYFPTADITTMYLYHHKDSDIEAYTNENLELIIKKQEEKIGITYPAERPAIEYILPEEYRILGLYDFTTIEKIQFIFRAAFWSNLNLILVTL
ncbi:MAG: hypothetical protein AABX31_02925 [Nanoarchaeota archaeon]